MKFSGAHRKLPLFSIVLAFLIWIKKVVIYPADSHLEWCRSSHVEKEETRYWLGNWPVSHRTPATLWCEAPPFSWLLPANTRISTVQRTENFLFAYLWRSMLQGAMRDKVNGVWKGKDKKFFEYFNNTRIWGNIFILKNVSFWFSNWVSVVLTHHRSFSGKIVQDLEMCKKKKKNCVSFQGMLFSEPSGPTRTGWSFRAAYFWMSFYDQAI